MLVLLLSQSLQVLLVLDPLDLFVIITTLFVTINVVLIMNLRFVSLVEILQFIQPEVSDGYTLGVWVASTQVGLDLRVSHLHH